MPNIGIPRWRFRMSGLRVLLTYVDECNSETERRRSPKIKMYQPGPLYIERIAFPQVEGEISEREMGMKAMRVHGH